MLKVIQIICFALVLMQLTRIEGCPPRESYVTDNSNSTTTSTTMTSTTTTEMTVLQCK
jgi:hypothetical protein